MNQFLQEEVTLTALSEQSIRIAKFGRSVPGSEVYRQDSILQFQSAIAKGIITSPVGVLTDLASIPNLWQGLFLKHDDPVIFRGAVIHDWLYGNKGRITVFANGKLWPMLLSRKECDWVLRECMDACGATPMQIDTVYDILRLLGDSWGDNYPLSERFSLT